MLRSSRTMWGMRTLGKRVAGLIERRWSERWLLYTLVIRKVGGQWGLCFLKKMLIERISF